jgi:Arc/MetJ-type ribon-helix-helix transcriptional regulator
MSTLSVPITKNLESFVEDMVKRGIASNKAEVVRQALIRYAEDQAVEAVLRSEQEAREGKVLRGDLKGLLKTMP